MGAENEAFLREEARRLRASGMTAAQVGNALALPSLKRVQQLLRAPKAAGSKAGKKKVPLPKATARAGATSAAAAVFRSPNSTPKLSTSSSPKLDGGTSSSKSAAAQASALARLVMGLASKLPHGGGAPVTLPDGRTMSAADVCIDVLSSGPDAAVPHALYNVAMLVGVPDGLTDDQVQRLRATGRVRRWTKKDLLLETLRFLPSHPALLELGKTLNAEQAGLATAAKVAGGSVLAHAQRSVPATGRTATVTLPDGRSMNARQLQQAYWQANLSCTDDHPLSLL